MENKPVRLADQLRQKLQCAERAALERFKETVKQRATEIIMTAQLNYISIECKQLPRGNARQAALDWLKLEGFEVTMDRDGDVQIKW